MDDSDFIEMLEGAGIPRHKDFYEEVKKWAGTCAEDSSDYERLIRLAAEYVGV